MLAYVFWHWPQDGIPEAAYEQALGRFHATLEEDSPDGFVSSAAFRIRGATWVPKAISYEDWYLITDFDALGNLNDEAVVRSHSTAHDQAARYAEGGTGGIYRAIVGQARLAPVRFAAWMSKPRAMGYAAFFAALASKTTQPDITLWQRQLTLGPASEFCLHAVERHELPGEFRPQWVELSPVWAPAARQS